jgi:hypothetical protein
VLTKLVAIWEFCHFDFVISFVRARCLQTSDFPEKLFLINRGHFGVIDDNLTWPSLPKKKVESQDKRRQP